MDDENLAKSALQKILDYQMPTGEWGYYSVSLKDRYLRVKREEYTRPEFLSLCRKPNGYRTLTAMEVLKDYGGNMFNSRIRKAVIWLKQNLSSGWFVEWDAFVSGPRPDRIDMPHVEKAPDIRHTAQALLGLLKFDRNPGSELPEGLCNILTCQFENGMWPRKPDFNHIEIFRSVCCADLLFHSFDRYRRKKLSKLGLREDFFPRARVALDRTCAWLIDCAEKYGGLWEDEYQTAMVLERLGRRLLADKRYAHVVESAITTLLERMTDKGWTNSSIAKPAIRDSEVSRYETTVRICASLCMIQRERSCVPEESLQPVLNYLHERFQPRVIDASDYRYFLQIFYTDCHTFRKTIQPEDFFDYLDREQFAQSPSCSHRDFLLHVMSLWVIDCLERLGGLAEGKALGLPNYDQAFPEKEKELLEILNTMHVISAGHPIEELPSSLLQYLRTPDLQCLWDRLEDRYHLQIERKSPLRGRVYREIKDIFTTIVAKFCAEKSPP